MDKSLLCLSYIKHMIEINTDVQPLLPNIDNIYCSIAPEGTVYPYVILTLDNLTVQYTKDRAFDNTISFTVTVYHNKYKDCMLLSNAIRAALENHQWKNKDEGFFIHWINMVSATTGVTPDYNYVTQMSFSTMME